MVIDSDKVSSNEPARDVIYNEKLQSVIAEIQEGIRNSANSYFHVGLNLYKDYIKELDNKSLYIKDNVQVIIGNLSISIELMLKAVIARDAFVYLYSTLPDEIGMALTYPSKVKAYNFLSELTAFKKPKSIEFNEAISRFLKLYPDQKKELSGYLENISDIRNNSVHAYLPKYNKHKLDHIVYAAIVLHDFCCELELFSDQLFGEDEFEAEFKKNYKKDRVGAYQKKMEKAKEEAKKRKLDIQSLPDFSGEWDKHPAACPICKSKGTLIGDTEYYEDVDYYDNGTDEPVFIFRDILTFYPSSFECSSCGLILIDMFELEYASLDNEINKSKFIKKWNQEKNQESDS